MPKTSTKKTSVASKKKDAAPLIKSLWTDGEYMPPAFGKDKLTAEASTARGADRTRGWLERNQGVIPSELRYPNLSGFTAPFVTSDSAFIDTKEAVKLCVRAYWAFPLLRNVVEVMVELSNSQLVLRGGNKKTRDFVNNWLKQVGAWKLKEQFFREWFRSGNFVCFRQDGELDNKATASIKEACGATLKKVPVKYRVLNPENLTVSGNFALGSPTYYQILTSFEKGIITTMKGDKTFNKTGAITPELIASALQAESASKVALDPDKLTTIFYKQQDYEPMGVPMAFGVLDDIEAKMELKRIDMSIARTTDRALLLLTVGETPTEYNRTPINARTQQQLQDMFANDSIARTLIADYTVKGEWLIPEIDKILGPEKYAQLDKDIKIGLNAIFFDSDEKFANASIKVQIFVERLKEARNAFIEQFLQPEVDRICNGLNSKSTPAIGFEELSLKDELQYNKFALSMAQLGLLTAEELYEALENGKMPSAEDSLVSQEKFKLQKEEGLYAPLLGGSTQLQGEQVDIQQQQADNQVDFQGQQIQLQQQALKQQAGRPAGSKAPQTTKKVSPIGKSKASEGFSLASLKNVFWAASDLHNKVEKKLRRKFNIKALSEAQLNISASIVDAIVSNEEMDEWADKISDYLSAPKDINIAAASEIDDIVLEHGVDHHSAALLRLTKKTLADEL